MREDAMGLPRPIPKSLYTIEYRRERRRRPAGAGGDRCGDGSDPYDCPPRTLADHRVADLLIPVSDG